MSGPYGAPTLNQNGNNAPSRDAKPKRTPFDVANAVQADGSKPSLKNRLYAKTGKLAPMPGGPSRLTPGRQPKPPASFNSAKPRAANYTKKNLDPLPSRGKTQPAVVSTTLLAPLPRAKALSPAPAHALLQTHVEDNRPDKRAREQKRKAREAELLTQTSAEDQIVPDADPLAKTSESLPGINEPRPGVVFDTGEEEDGIVRAGRPKKRIRPTVEKPLPPNRDPFAFIASIREKPNSLEFVYLNALEDDATVFNPYRLEIVPHSHVSPDDYYTMSAAGVTHFVRGVAEFTPLDQWEREYFLFGQIMNITLFRQYRMWKAFHVWRKNVRGRKLKICKEVMEASLFILNPVIREALLQVRDYSISVTKLRLYKVEDDKTYTLSEFAEQQEEQKEEILQRLAGYSREVRAAVAIACEHVLNGPDKQENGEDQAVLDPEGDMMDIDGNGDMDHHHQQVVPHPPTQGRGPGNRGGRSALLATANEGDAEAPRMSYTDMAARRTECRRLTSFIRLADYLVIDTLHQLTMASVHGLLELLLYIEEKEARTARKDSNGDDAMVGAGEGEGLDIRRESARSASPAAGDKGDVDSGDADENPNPARSNLDIAAEKMMQSLMDLNELAQDKEEDEDDLAAIGRQLSRPSGTGDEVTLEDEDAASQASGDLQDGGVFIDPTPAVEQSVLDQATLALQATMGALASETDPLEARHRKIPLFKLEVLYENDELIAEPNGADFQRRTDTILSEFIRAVQSVDRLLTHDDFKEYTAPSSGNGRVEVADTSDGPDLASMILVDQKYQRLVNGIVQSLTRAFMDIDIYTAIFRPFKAMYNQNSTMTLDYMRENTQLHKLQWFKAAIEKFQGQIESIQSLDEDARIGFIVVQNERLKETFLPSPEACLNAIHTLVPELARKRNEDLLEIINSAVAKLSASPDTVEGFVEYLDFLEEITEKQDALQADFEGVKEMYNLMEAYNVAVPPEDTALYQTLVPSFQQLKATMTIAESSKDNSTVRFSEILERNIAALNQNVSQIRTEAQDPMIGDPDAEIADVQGYVNKLHEKMTEYKNLANNYARYQEIFRVPVARYEELEDAAADINLKKVLWDSQQKWQDLTAAWTSAQFDSIDSDDISANVQRFSKICMQVEKGLPNNKVGPKFKAMVDEFKSTVPIVLDLRNDSLKLRHWNKIEDTVGFKFIRDETFTLGLLIEMKVLEYKDAIATISLEATNEAVLEETLKKVEMQWSRTDFTVLGHKDHKDVYILSAVDDIILPLEDSRMTVSTIRASRYVGPIQNEVEEWDRLLSLFAETLEEWIACQRQWLYLESIFSAPDIQRQLPNEAKMFSAVDKSWKDHMRRTHDNPNALKCCTGKGVLEMFKNANSQLDKVQKCLEDYLETKRLAFPRFFFLSNDELLEILAQTKNPHAVQPHLSKCFDSIKTLEFSDEPKSIEIFAMISAEGERVGLGKNLKARGNVENWLGAVEQAMIASLRKLTKSAVQSYETQSRSEWVMEHCSQIVQTVTQIYWCRDVTASFAAQDPLASMAQTRDKCISQLIELAQLVRGDLTKLQRRTLEALITLDVHSRDIVEELVRDRISNVNDFGWQQRLRYYWETEIDDCVARMVNTSFVYGYEYLGCNTRLVVTPLTDRCYMTLTGALHLQLGGSPAGPAGTGKTETVKDLAKALARQCVVFNCSDGLDYKIMGRFFSGLAQCGAWCCFDEFNRIEIEVLSVIAQQLLTIRTALSANLSTFLFEGREIKLNPQLGYFITMNPGYAGRTELPDNLKALFRPVAMMIPDYALIAEIILFSAGFEMGRVLAQKMVKMYSLCSEQLSQQDHYDFGMRAVKSVLVMAGELRRSNPDSGEDVVLIRAMRDSNVPKFLAEDLPLFQGILQDLFPGVELPEHDYGALQVQIENTLRAKNLQVAPILIKKCIQLYETMIVRHGVMLVGPTGGGKTTCYQVLEDVLTTLRENGHDDPTFQNVESFVLNPKCISMGELYGEFDPISLEWSDGLVAYIIRQVVVDETEDQKWIVFDGPVDALWIENMNTVLDDNKLLCLANSERIKLNNTIHLLFEVADLAVASPATVSRCGMVYMEPEDLGWRPFVQTWITSLPEEIPEELREHIMMEQFEMYIDPGLQFIRSSDCRELLPTTDNSLVHGLCSFFSSLLENPDHPILWDELLADDQKAKNFLNMCFAFSYTWSLGGSIDGESQLNFDTFFRDTLANIVVFPGAGMVYDYFLDFETKTLQPWNDIVPKFEFNREIPYFQMLVPTVDTVRFSYLLDKLIKVQKACLFVGETGVGKSVITQKALADKVEEGDILNICLSFSAQTSSARTQEIIEGKLEKKRKNMRGPPVGKKMVLFVDDINMPKLDTYGAQPPIELLRQYLDFGGFYDREKLFWMDIVDVTLVAACAPPGGGRNAMTARLTRHFNQLFIPAPSENSLKRIFNAIMEGFLEPFQPKVKSMASALVDASVEVYNRISAELLPTPSRSHYTFNLRDLSKVFQGILQARVSSVPMPDIMLRLWCHEEMRVFHDRLIDKHDKEWFTELLIEMLRRHFSVGWTHEDTFEQQPIIFGDFARMGVAVEDRVYEEIPNIRRVAKLLDDYLDEYNMNSKKEMRLVFFTDAIEHVSRIQRIIRQPRGNALLVGVGGCGKRSLTRLACTMAEYQCFEIELTKGYGMNEFRDDLKKLYTMTAVDGEQVVFLLSDTQIAEEEFLEDVNNILNSGEVPNLFETDEYEKLLAGVAPFAREKGFGESRDALHNCMVERVRDNLHIVLTMSPVGELFRSRCRQYPSLVNCCTIDWFSVWPRDALLSVSRNFLFDEDLGSQEVSEAVAQLCVYVHESVTSMSEVFYNEQRRRNYTTPTSYLELINLYTATLEAKRNEIVGNRDRLRNGVKKLLDTNESVGVMQVELNEIQPILKQKSIDTEKLLAQVAKEQEVADGVRKVVMAEEAVVSEQTKETEALAADAQKDLDAALPALEGAIAALNSLNKGDISEIKSFTSPPPLVMLVMEAVCILCKAKPDWPTAKSLLTDANFLKNLIQFDKDNIPEPVLKKLNKYLGDPNFNPTSVGRVSNAAKSLCMWCIAIAGYSVIAKEVAPKRARLAEASEMLRQSQAQLQEKQDKLAEVENQLAALRATYETALAEKVQLSERLDDVSKRIQRASKLISALGEEQSRWETSSENYNAQLPHLVGDVFLSVCCVAYFGAFTSAYRKQLVEDWHAKAVEAKIPCSEKFDLINTVGDPVQIRDWQIAGLPSDDVSVENGILVTQGRRWPLMIDPQGQANRWIKNLETKNNLKVIRLSEPNYLRTLENAIRIGAPVLLEHIGETLDPSLEPILMKQTFKLSGRTVIRIGDTDVDYDPTFRFYITTKLANPHYLPEVCIKVTIINFTVTLTGLEDQLLADVVRAERQELEEQKDRLVVSMAADKRQLKDLEDKILRLLSATEGNILDDEVVINTLNESKVTSGIISVRVKEAEETEVEINIARERYRSVATRGSILYFVLADIANIDPMYQYSLEYFKNLFNLVLEVAEKSEDLETRLKTLITDSTSATYKNVCRGLFDNDKVIFSFMMCVSIMLKEDKIPRASWMYLLRGNTLINRSTQPECDADWVTPKMWDQVVGLQTNIKGFDKLVISLNEESQDWKTWFDSDEPHKAKLPGEWDTSLDDFQRMLVVRALRPEKVMFSITEFVIAHLGPEFVVAPPFDLESVFGDTHATSPIILILSPGADPTDALLKFAKAKEYSDRMHIMSLGQGQGPLAAKLISKATMRGDWVLLQNCHLAASWMPSLEKIIEGFHQAGADIHEDFRLWLTSMPTKSFPVSVLQAGVKLTNEAPKGLVNNLTRSFHDISAEQFEGCTKPTAFKKLLFGLVFFHGLLLERRKFGPLGWNITYEFTDTDRQVGMSYLKMILELEDDINWKALRYLTGDIIYGGRVTDDWDRRCLKSILDQFYHADFLVDGFKITKSGVYRVPDEGPQESFLTYIASLPVTDPPEVFGLHDNANISYQNQETDRILTTISNTQPRDNSASTAQKPEEIVADLATEILGKLPKALSQDEATSTPGRGRSLPIVAGNSLSTVLLQEMVRFNKLLRTMSSSLVQLGKAIKGMVVMSEQLEAMFYSMLNNEVPQMWATVAYPSLKPLGSWVTDLHKRIQFLRKWLSEGQPPAYWLPGFFFPQGFMTGVLQNHARKYQIPIDTLSFSYSVLKTEHGEAIVDPPEDGVFVYGLFFDGGRWDRERRLLGNSLPGEIHSTLPVIHFKPTPNLVRNPEDYNAPLYKTSRRAGVLSTTGHSTNFVVAIDLPTDMEPAYWIRQGTALLCALND